MSNFDFDLSLKLFQREVHDFSGEVQTFSREVENDLRGDAHLPTPPLQIWPCLIPIRDNVYQCGANVLLFCFVFHSKQITLNETRDTLRETYKMVSDVHSSCFSVFPDRYSTTKIMYGIAHFDIGYKYRYCILQ
jgi:hypothetical protein